MHRLAGAKRLRRVNSRRAQFILIRALPPLSHSGRVVPGVMSRSTEAVEADTREVSLDVEDVVNGGVDGDEALG